jgi:hypothetical protein
MHDLRIECSYGRDLPQLSIPALGSTQQPMRYLSALLLRGSLQERGLIHSPLLAQQLKKEYSYTYTSLWSFMIISRTTFTFYTTCKTVSWVPIKPGDVTIWQLKMTSILAVYVVTFIPS